MFKQTCVRIFFFFISFFHSSRVAHSNREGVSGQYSSYFVHARPERVLSHTRPFKLLRQRNGARVLKLHYQSRQTSKLRVEFGVQICFRVCSCTLRCVGIRLIIECKQVRQGGGFCAIHLDPLENGMTRRCIPRNSFIPSHTILQNVIDHLFR